MGLYNAAAWLKRRDAAPCGQRGLYAALAAWEQKHVAHHLRALRRVRDAAAGRTSRILWPQRPASPPDRRAGDPGLGDPLNSSNSSRGPPVYSSVVNSPRPTPPQIDNLQMAEPAPETGRPARVTAAVKRVAGLGLLLVASAALASSDTLHQVVLAWSNRPSGSSPSIPASARRCSSCSRRCRR